MEVELFSLASKTIASVSVELLTRTTTVKMDRRMRKNVTGVESTLRQARLSA